MRDRGCRATISSRAHLKRASAPACCEQQYQALAKEAFTSLNGQMGLSKKKGSTGDGLLRL